MPQDPDDLEAHRTFQLRAVQEGLIAALRETYHDLVAQNPTSATAHYLYGRLVADPTDALVSFERAVACDPSLFWAHYGKGTVLLELGRYGEAATSLERAVELREGFAPAHLGLAQALLRLGQTAAAQIHYETAARLAPDLAGLDSLKQHLLAAETDIEQTPAWALRLRHALTLVVLLLAINFLLLRNARRKLAEATRSPRSVRRRHRRL